MSNLKLQLEDFLGLTDIFDITQRRDNLNKLANEMLNLNTEERYLIDIIYTKLSELYSDTYSDIIVEDNFINSLYKKNPIYSIQTASSIECNELKSFIDRLSTHTNFDAHLSVKLKGWSVRLVYVKGQFERAFNKLGKDLTEQLRYVLEDMNCLIIEDFEDLDVMEIRGTLIISKTNEDSLLEFVTDNLTLYTGLSYVCNTLNKKSEWSLLNFLAFDIVADGFSFSSKTDIFQYLEELGFDVPLYWNLESLNKENLIDDLPSIVSDCELEVRATDIQDGYNYETDGLIFTVDDMNYFNKLGKSSQQYYYGNINLKIGYWKQTLYEGYIQTILWKVGRNKLQPYAVLAEKPNLIEYEDLGDYTYIFDYDMVMNKRSLGVNLKDRKILEVPLFNPSTILRLDAYVGTKLLFVDNPILGLLPCFDDGRVVVDGYIKNSLDGEC